MNPGFKPASEQMHISPVIGDICRPQRYNACQRTVSGRLAAGHGDRLASLLVQNIGLTLRQSLSGKKAGVE